MTASVRAAATAPGHRRAPLHAHPPAPLALDRLAFASGVVGGVLYLVAAALFVAVVIPGMPSFGAPAAARAAYYAAASESLGYRMISYLGSVQLLFLLPFIGGLLGVLRRADEGDRALSFTVLAAGVALALVSPIALVFEDHLLLGFAAAGVDPRVTVAVDGLVPMSFALGAMPQALVVGGAAIVLRRRCVIPRWLGWSGVAVAALSLAGTATLVRGSLFPVSHLAALLARLWLLALAIALRPRGRAARVR